MELLKIKSSENAITFRTFSLKTFAVPYYILVFLAASNSVNLIDGLDGLAVGVTKNYLICYISIIAVAERLLGINIANRTETENIAVLVCSAIGSLIAFNCFNAYPAKIFMGDSGSMFLGYIIAVIALLGFKNVTLTSFIIPILLLAIPILDTLFAILRRLINHKPLGEPDKNHLHHQLLKLKLSQKKTVIIIYIVDLLFASASIVYAVGNSMLGSNIYGMVIYAILFVLILLLILKTNIIWNHDKKKEKAKEETKEK